MSMELPPLGKILKTIPKSCFQKDSGAAFSYLFRDIGLILGFSVLILWLDNWMLALPVSLLLGTAATGLFVVGHDAGHRSFSDSVHTNNIVGNFATGVVGWPFHSWRLSHDIHHKWTHHAFKEIAWNPWTIRKYNNSSALDRGFYRISRTWMFFQASILFTAWIVIESISGTMFKPEDRAKLLRSVLFTAVVQLVLAITIFNLGGIYGLLFLYIIPISVFHFWLSLMTILHHTSPDTPLMGDDAWTPSVAQLGSSFHIKYPGWIDWLTHDIAWHVPHHVSTGIPHYRLREAHFSLKGNYPDIVKEIPLTLDYVKRVITECHLIDERSDGVLEWKTFADADLANLSAKSAAGAAR